MSRFRVGLAVQLKWSFFCKQQELEALADPMRKEVAQVRKKIDAVNKELKPLGHTCQKKVRFGGKELVCGQALLSL